MRPSERGCGDGFVIMVVVRASLGGGGMCALWRGCSVREGGGGAELGP